MEFTNAQGEKEADYAQLLDFTWASRIDLLVLNQFTITGTKKPRRPDLACFVNGLVLKQAEALADDWTEQIDRKISGL